MRYLPPLYLQTMCCNWTVASGCPFTLLFSEHMYLSIYLLQYLTHAFTHE